MVEKATSFEFATAQRIIVGRGTVRQIGAAAVAFGRRAFVVCGRSPARAQPVCEALSAAGVESIVWPTAGEPDTDDISAGVAAARDARADVVVCVGGGSALDTGKAIAAIAANEGSLFDYLEVVGAGRPLERPAWPVLTVPTTAGTGSEVTRNAVIASREHRVKVSLRSAFMLPRVAIVDPELTMGLPPEVTATTGLDALTQLIEPLVSSRANPMTDALCVAGIRRAATALPRAWRDGSDLDAREDMAIASLWSGMALANAGLGAVHGLAGPIGGMFGAPHGAICAALLPHVMAGNIAALRARTDDARMARYDEVARQLTGRSDATADEGVQWVRTLCRELAIPPLAAYGVTAAHVDEIVPHAQHASSMKGNPIALTNDEVADVLAAAIARADSGHWNS